MALNLLRALGLSIFAVGVGRHIIPPQINEYKDTKYIKNKSVDRYNHGLYDKHVIWCDDYGLDYMANRYFLRRTYPHIIHSKNS